MSANAPGIRPQAIVKVVPRGGTVNAHEIRRQIGYVTRNGAIPFRRSDRYLDAVPAGIGEFDRISVEWARHAARYPLRNLVDGTPRDLTTHVVVSLPRNTPHQLAEETMRDYAYEMFGSGRNGGQWDYFTAFHTDREHPHLHIVVNRMSHDGRWLKISRRDPFMNYDNMRAVMSDVAHSRGINLDSTSRAERGIIERPVTSAEYRRRARDRVFIYPQPTNNTPVEPNAIIGPSRTGAANRRNAAEHGIAERAAAVQRGFVNGQEFQAARQRGRDIAAAAAARARQLFPEPQDDLDDDLGGGGFGGDDDDDDDDDDDQNNDGADAENNNGGPAGNGNGNGMGMGMDGMGIIKIMMVKARTIGPAASVRHNNAASSKPAPNAGFANSKRLPAQGWMNSAGCV